MLDWSIEQNEFPVAIRVPCNGVISSEKEVERDYSNLNKFKVEEKGNKVAIIALGDFFEIGRSVLKGLKEELGISATLINPRYITGLDEEYLEDLKQDHDIVITLEDGMLEGGFGEKIASFYGTSDMKVKNYGIKKSFPDRYNVEDLLRENRITKEQIIEDIKNIMK